MADVRFDDLPPGKPSPNQYDPLFEKHGRAFGIDPLLLKAQAKVESGMNPQAESGTGAQGLMQLMPINQRRFGVTNPFDPDQNIRGAASLQQENFKRAEGDPAMALAYYHGGPDIAQHGPKTLAYRDRVLSEYERLKPKPQDVTFDDLPPAKEEGTGGRGFLGVAKDIGIGLGQGVIQFPGGLYNLGNAVTGGALDRGTKALSAAIEGGEGESFSAKVNRSQQILADLVGQSKELTAKQQELNRISNDPNAAVGKNEWEKQFNSFVTGFGYVLLNPDLAVNLFAQSVPSMAGMAGATRKATEMAIARHATEKTVQRVGEYANVLVNGLMEGGDSAGQTKQAIMGMSFEDLQAGSADYRQLRAYGKSPEQAREEVADKAARVAAILGGVIGGAASKVTGAASFEAKVFGKGTGKIAKGVSGLAGNVGRETAEEGLQNAGDQFGQNVGTQLHANASQNLAEGVAAQAGPGAAIGALTGGAFHGVGMLGGKTTPEQTPPPPPPSLQFGDKKVTSTPELQAHLATVKPEERHAALVKALGLTPEDEGHAALKNVLDLVHPDQHAQAIGAKFFGDVDVPLPHTPVTDKNFEATVEAGIAKLHTARAEIVANHPEGEALSKEQEKQLHVLDQRILALQDQGTKSLLADAKTIFEAAKNKPSIFTTIRDAANEMPKHTKPTVEKLVENLEADPKSIFAQATQTPDIVRTVAKAVEGSFSIKENTRHGQTQEANAAAAPESNAERSGRAGEGVGGEEAKGAISATGIHYSQAPRQVLSSHHYGTGKAGEEFSRVLNSADERIKKRLYFYINNGEGIRKEGGVGSHTHRASLKNLYDFDSDPLNLYQGNRSSDHNAFESSVLDHGYDGYVSRAHDAAVMLGDHSVKAEYLGTNADVSKTPVIGKPTFSEGNQVAKALTANRDLPFGEMSGKDWAADIKRLSPEISARLDKLGVTEWLKKQTDLMHKTDIIRRFHAAPENIGEAIAKHTAENGGGTFDPRTGTEFSGTNGYMVSEHKDREKIVKGKPSAKDISNYVDANEDLFLQPRNMLGTWFNTDNGSTYLDVSHLVQGLDKAKEIGQKHDQLAIWDLRNSKEIRLGQPPSFSIKRSDQTETAAFKKWFGDSKVVDAEGKPLVVYHGTAIKKDSFRREGGAAGVGAYFTADKAVAKDFADMDASVDGEKPIVMPVYLAMKNPYRIAFEFNRDTYDKDADPQAVSEKFRDRLEAEGYDGIIITNTGEYVAFRPEQIKSAIGNKGTFDQNNPDISLKLSEKPKHHAFKHLTDEEISKLRDDTAEKFLKMYNELPSAEEMAVIAHEGKAKRGWYKRSVQAILDVYGMDAPRFAALLASMSPQTNVKDNFEMSIGIWDAWVKAGRPTTTDGILKAMRAGLKDRGKAGVLAAWFGNTVRSLKAEDPSSLTISGPKVNSFMRNLQGDVNEVTNDGWMAAFANIDKTLFGGRLTKGVSPGKRPMYLALNAKTRHAAKILSKLTGENWTPAEVQETIWSWTKTLYELQERAGEKRGARQLLADGELTDKLIASTPDFGRMFASHGQFKSIIDKAEARRSDQAGANERPVARGETAPFDREATARATRRAAGRLEQLREQRLADEANKRIAEETGGAFSRKGNTVTVEEARGTGTDAAIYDLTRIVRNFLGKEAPAGPLFERAAPGKAEAHLSQAVAKVFGQQVVFFRNVDPDSFFFDGMAAKPEHGGRIYLNIAAESPFLNTTGHEFLHKLRDENPALYKELSKEIWKHLDERGASKHMTQIRKMYSDLKLSEDKVREEVVADVAGDVMATKEFWQDISKREPSLFRSLADVIIKFLNSAAEKLRGTFGTEKFVKDIDAVRSAVVGAYVEWARQSPQYKEAIKRPSFDEWFGDSVTKDKNGPQVFYHGTAREFKQFKPKQANAIFFTTSPRFAEDFSANSLLWVADQISTQQMLEKYGEPGDKELLDKQEFKNYMDSAPAIYPVFLKAEMPFDWENHDHIGQLDSWLYSEYAPNLGEAGNSEFMKDQREAKGSPIQYKSHKALLNSVANGDWTAIEHPIVQKFIRSQGFDSFYTQEALLKNIAVLNPNQVKSIFSTNFETSPDFSIKPGTLVNDLFSDAGKSYVSSTPRQRKLYIKAGERALGQINHWIGNRLSPLGAMPNEGLYTVQRGVMMGLIAKADETAGNIGDIFNKATDADRKAVYEYWTTAFGRNTAIADPEVRQTAVDVKKRIEDIGDMLAKRGLVDAKDIAANRGKYVPRLYLKHLLNEADWRAVGAGKSLSDLGYTKKRKDIPEHIRLALLGEIREPGFLGAMAVGKPLRDIAILDFLDTVSKNKEWAWDGSVTTYNGQRVSVPWLKNEATRLEEQAAYYDDPALKKAAMDEAEAMRKVYLPLEQKAGKASEDYAQIPDTPRYGLLRGMWVRKEIREDLIGSAHLNPNGTGWAENFFGYGGIGTKLTQAWKTSKVALNPPGQVRNFISNMILLHLSGVPMHMIPMRLAQSIQAIRTKNKYWDIAQKYGITEGTFGAQELYRLERELLEDKGEGGPFAFLRYAKKLASFAGDVYQKMEEIGKIAKVIDEMENGSDETHAVIQAQRWLFDYSLVPKSVRFLRNNPIGIPFMTFYYKLAPRMLEVMLTAPHRLVPYIGAAYLLPMLVASMYGATPDDLEKLKKALPEWLREKQHVYVLPEKDSTGRWQFLDLSYLMPWTMFTDAARQVKDGKFTDLLSTVGLFSGPILDSAIAIKTNMDPFTKREIANKGDPVSLQIGSWLTWLYNMAMPPVLTNRGLIGPDLGDPNYNFGGRLHQNLFGTTNKYGEAKQTNAQTVSSAFGVNVYPINPRTSRIAEMQKMQMQMMDSERMLIQKLGDKGLSPESRQNTIDTYRKEMRKRVDALKQYATDSQVPANLQ